MDERRGGGIEALREVIREASQEPTPEVDWDRVEARLFERIERASQPARKSNAWRYALAIAAAAAIALVSFALLRSTHAPQPIGDQRTPSSHEPGPQLIGPEVSGIVDGSKLAVGDRVLAGAREIVVDHPGRARWTLSPGSQAALSDAGERLTIRLESGAVLASVAHSAKPESFAVVTSDVRIAVHGTSFRVERRAERALVTVNEGVVAVGPAVVGRTEGFLLHAGDQGSFTFDGKTGTVQRAAATAQLSAPPAHRAPIAPRTPSTHPVTPPPPLPETPTTADLERGLDGVAAGVTRCFVDHTKSGEVRITARTQLTAKVAPDGSIAQLSFEPPLAPDVEKCVRNQRTSKFPASEKGAVVDRSILLAP